MTNILDEGIPIQLERLIRRDPARRGLIGSEGQFGPLCPGHLHEAAEHMAANGASVAIVSGFFIPRGDPPAAETDGPLGSLFLAVVLDRLGIETSVITDAHCISAMSAAAEAMQFPLERILEGPAESCLEEFFQSPSVSKWTHLVSLERVGPSHTAESMAAQSRTEATPHGDFDRRVPQGNRDRCHNMRGEVIDAHTADLHRLFEFIGEHRPQVKTIGIGDGANEIGMGSILWEDLHRRLGGEHSGWVPCRVPTDWTVVAGTSNWGGYALAAAVAFLKGKVQVLEPFDGDDQLRILQHIVENGPAVDGVTLRREPTVDGLPFATYIQPLEGMRRLLGIGG